MVTAQQQYSDQDYYIYEPGPVKQGTLYIDGSTIDLETGLLISPVIGSDMSSVTPAEWREIARIARETFATAPNKTVISPGRAGRGLNIVFNCTNTPPEAVGALESTATYIEQLFADDATVTINITFAPLGPGIIGQAQSYIAGNPSWTVTRSSLVADMDADDSIHTYLPSGSTIPVRYNYGSPTAINEDRCYFRVALWNAVIGSYPSLAAQITFSTNFSFDYDPTDGITSGTMCFQSIAAHEIGHVLGFACGTWLTSDIETMDIYRFQRSDSTFDYNPDDFSEFGTTARMVASSPGNDDVNADLIEVEYRMSDGNPYQTSHFSMGNVAAIMQPAFNYGQTYYPNLYRIPDRNMFDAIGWDYVLSYYLTTNITGEGSVEREPDTCWFAPGTPVQLTAIPDSGWMFYNWYGGLTGNQNPDTVIMDTDKIVTAAFLTLYVTLTINIIGNGTVNLNPNLPQYPRFTPVELTAIPDPGWTFQYWSGNLGGSQNPDTLIMNEDKTVNAHFTQTGIEESKLDLLTNNYLTVSPNPTSGVTDIRYMIRDTGYEMDDVSIMIYDVSGKLVKSFRSTPDALRPTQISWDGTDQSDRQVGNGVYFVKLRAGDYQATSKLMLVR
jgi:hypothetical protein